MSRITSHPVLPIPEGRLEASFSFDGRPVTGFAGEPVASALVALGISRFSLHPKDGAPQGLFCANGQCSQCTVLIDGIPRKSCVTPLAEGMDVRTLEGLPVLPDMDAPLVQAERRAIHTDILIIGGGPSGLSAAYELGRMGFQVVVADDKEKLGGKLVLQTHKFFGSEEDCYAGVRGVDIAGRLEEKLQKLPNVTILRNAPVVAVFKDRKAGIYKDYSSYLLVEFTAMVVASGAREKSILFPGNDLPGVYGAGAFQTLVNRDLVGASKKILIVGSGNVGLIAAYHALQAGIQVAGIVEIMGRVNGYKVHADKIRRMGVPIHLNTTILRTESGAAGTGQAGGKGEVRVTRAVTAKVDDQFRPIPGTAVAYDVDTILIATGLASCDEFLRQARDYGILAVAAGDAEEIAEASSAMFGGKIAAFALTKMLGKRIEMDASWLPKRDVLKSRPGDCFSRSPVMPGPEWRPVFFCSEEIPCNPCTTVCPVSAISLRPIRGNIMDLPYFSRRQVHRLHVLRRHLPGPRDLPGPQGVRGRGRGRPALGVRGEFPDRRADGPRRPGRNLPREGGARRQEEGGQEQDLAPHLPDGLGERHQHRGHPRAGGRKPPRAKSWPRQPASTRTPWSAAASESRSASSCSSYATTTSRT